MEESPIIFVLNLDEFKDVLIEMHSKNWGSMKMVRKYGPVSLSLLLSFFIAILISCKHPKYGFAIAIFLLLFLLSLFSIPVYVYKNYKMKKDLRRLDKAFGQFKYYKIIVTEEEITIETDIEINIQKWQEVSEVAFDTEVMRFNNGVSSYFFVERSMQPADVMRLKELIQRKSKHIFSAS